jgi:hypothetical protein
MGDSLGANFFDAPVSSNFILAFFFSQGFEQLQSPLIPGMLPKPPQLPLSSLLFRITPSDIPKATKQRIRNVNKKTVMAMVSLRQTYNADVIGFTK